MDDIDIKILKQLLLDSRRSYRDLADDVELTVPTVYKRVQSMIDDGIIRGFRADLGIEYLNAIQVHFLGSCRAKNLEDIINSFEKDENTRVLHIGSNDHIHVGGLLKDISELDGYNRYIRETTGMDIDHIGMMNHSEYDNDKIKLKESGVKRLPLNSTDKRIIGSIHSDARKKITDIAGEIGCSAKTARKRLKDLIDNKVLEFSLDWNPSTSGDIVPFIHIYLTNGPERDEIYRKLENGYDRLVFNFLFHNIPDLIVSTAWVENLHQLEEMKIQLESEDGIEYVNPITIFSGHHFLTWRERKLQEFIE